MWRVDPISKELVPLVNKFYKANRGRARARSSDKVWVVREHGEMVAALRVMQLSGHEFLTGVQVALDKQGMGIATAMLTQVFEHLYANGLIKPCYTFPYVHLIAFYRRLGWVEINKQELPKPLQSRFERYLGQGRDIGAMVFYAPIENSLIKS